MDPWLHLVPKTLTVRHLASPVVHVQCDRDEPVGVVVDKVQEHLKYENQKNGGQVRRATVVFDEPGDFARFVILDWCLTDPGWLQEFRDDPVSVFEREASVETETSSETTFDVALQRFVAINPDVRRDHLSDGKTKLVEMEHHLLVFTDGRMTGAMRAEHFRTVPIRLAVFSYLLELEEIILERAKADLVASLACLSAERIDRAAETSRRSGYWNQLDGTMFIDKMTIARKQGWCWNGNSGSSIKSTISRLERVRNWCVHTGADSSQVYLDDIAFAISTTKDLVLELS
jgi:hypothetical protein